MAIIVLNIFGIVLSFISVHAADCTNSLTAQKPIQLQDRAPNDISKTLYDCSRKEGPKEFCLKYQGCSPGYSANAHQCANDKEHNGILRFDGKSGELKNIECINKETEHRAVPNPCLMSVTHFGKNFEEMNDEMRARLIDASNGLVPAAFCQKAIKANDENVAEQNKEQETRLKRDYDRYVFGYKYDHPLKSIVFTPSFEDYKKSKGKPAIQTILCPKWEYDIDKFWKCVEPQSAEKLCVDNVIYVAPPEDWTSYLPNEKAVSTKNSFVDMMSKMYRTNGNPIKRQGEQAYAATTLIAMRLAVEARKAMGCPTIPNEVAVAQTQGFVKKSSLKTNRAK